MDRYTRFAALELDHATDMVLVKDCFFAFRRALLSREMIAIEEDILCKCIDNLINLAKRSQMHRSQICECFQVMQRSNIWGPVLSQRVARSNNGMESLIFCAAGLDGVDAQHVNINADELIQDSLVRQEVLDAMETFEVATPVIGFIGKRGVGKSTLMNSLMRKRPQDPGAAKVGADEVVTDEQLGEGASYNYAGMILRDVPGCEGSLVEAQMGESYIKEFKLDQMDGIVFLYTSVMEPRMVQCATQLRGFGIPVFIVRNKVGQDCRNQLEDGNFDTQQEAFDNIRQRAENQIASIDGGRHFVENNLLFLIEAKYEHAVRQIPPQQPFQHDFHRLKEAIATHMRDEATAAIVDSIFKMSVSKLAQMRSDQCRAIVWKYTLAGMGSGAMPFSFGAGSAAVAGTGGLMVKHFLAIYRLNSSISEDEAVQEMISEVVGIVLMYLGAKMAMMASIDFAIDSFLLPIPFGAAVGFVVGGGVGGLCIQSMASFVIPKFELLAQKVYSLTLQSTGSTTEIIAWAQKEFSDRQSAD